MMLGRSNGRNTLMQHVSVTSDFTELSGLNVPALIASGDTPFADWLHFHQLSVDTIVNCIAHIESGHLRLNVDEHPVDEHAGGSRRRGCMVRLCFA